MRGPDEKISSMVLSHGGRAMPMFSLRYIVAHQHGRPVGISHGELQNTSAWRVRPGSKRHLATAVYPRLKHLRTHKTIVTCVVSNGKFFTSIHRFSSSDRLCKQSGHTCKELSIGYNTSNHRFVPSEMSRGRPPVRPRGALSVAAATSGPGKLSPLPAGTAAPMFSLRYIWSGPATACKGAIHYFSISSPSPARVVGRPSARGGLSR